MKTREIVLLLIGFECVLGFFSLVMWRFLVSVKRRVTAGQDHWFVTFLRTWPGATWIYPTSDSDLRICEIVLGSYQAYFYLFLIQGIPICITAGILLLLLD